MFRVAVLVIVLSLQWMMFYRTSRWAREQFPTSPWVRRAVAALFALFNLAFVVVVFMRPRAIEFPEWFRLFGMYPFFIWYGSTFLLGVLLLVVGIVKLPFSLMLWLSRRAAVTRSFIDRVSGSSSYRKFDASRRLFLRRGMEGLTAVTFMGSTYGVLVGKEKYDITEASFELEGLDPAFDGFTIGLVTDVHSSVFMTRSEMDEYVRTLNALRTDMVMVGGDFVNGQTQEVYPFAESFSQLSAPHGVYGVTGNHDYYVSNPDLVIREVNDCGVRLLHDDRVTLSRGNGRLHILGIDDTGSGARANDRILHAKGRQLLDGPSVLLCHRPYYLPQAAENGVDLMLSGHTHGGQVVLASLGGLHITPAALASPYISGTYRSGKTAMYVSRGIGTVGIPVRINCPPEITRITLRSPRRRAGS